MKFNKGFFLFLTIVDMVVIFFTMFSGRDLNSYSYEWFMQFLGLIIFGEIIAFLCSVLYEFLDFDNAKKAEK